MTGAERIAAERQRQIEVEGWTPEDDAEHTEGELVRAAEFYLHAGRLAERAPEVLASVRGYIERQGENPDNDRDVQRIAENYPRHYYGWNEIPREWPWDPSWWKPSADPIRNLEKAGALIAAEIDRLLREAKP